MRATKDGDEFAKVLALFDRFVDIPLSDGPTSGDTKGSSRTPPSESLPTPPPAAAAAAAAVSSSIPSSSSTSSSLVGGRSVEIIENYGGRTAGPTATEVGRQENGSNSNNAVGIAQAVSQESERKDSSAVHDSTAASTATVSSSNATASSNSNTTSVSQPSSKPATLSWAESMRFGNTYCYIVSICCSSIIFT